MPQVKIPDGIVRAVSVVQAHNEVMAIYIDGIRKAVGYIDAMSALDMAELLVEENVSGKVIHVTNYTCDEFFENVCLEDVDRFEELVPELLQHLKTDEE